ncbi:helix-turn-helix domain-containing protein [Cnuibacter sp. UC19_7]|uniref:helix-turn-helix domain-containing protein n=1 Tax=Cnuibacter sp. UC19_7 TaxID=3350166 RepID=UPI003672CCFD
MAEDLSSEEWEQRLGERIRALRLAADLAQSEVAERAGISVGSVKNLESGRGSSVSTLVKVLRALDRERWIDALEPEIAVSPLRMLQRQVAAVAPRRASRKGNL